MSLPMVLLSALTIAPSTGYDLTRSFSGVTGNYWRASHQQVYRELNTLLKGCAVTCKVIPQEGKPDRKLYTITNVGSLLLSNWRETAFVPDIIRDDLVVRLFTCRTDGKQPVVDTLKQIIIDTKQLITTHRTFLFINFSNLESLPLEIKLEFLSVRRLICNWEAQVSWAEEALSVLRRV